MGTETHRQIEHLSPCLNLRVKLNNPLMGTETCHTEFTGFSLHNLRVKLNNPLMGTETLYRLFS